MKPEQSLIEMYDVSDKRGRDQFEFFLDLHGESIQDYFKLDNFYITVRRNFSIVKYIESEELFHGVDVNIAIASAITAANRV